MGGASSPKQKPIAKQTHMETIDGVLGDLKRVQELTYNLKHEFKNSKISWLS